VPARISTSASVMTSRTRRVSGIATLIIVEASRAPRRAEAARNSEPKARWR
jgi:hypothetical protein